MGLKIMDAEPLSDTSQVVRFKITVRDPADTRDDYSAMFAWCTDVEPFVEQVGNPSLTDGSTVVWIGTFCVPHDKASETFDALDTQHGYKGFLALNKSGEPGVTIRRSTIARCEPWNGESSDDGEYSTEDDTDLWSGTLSEMNGDHDDYDDDHLANSDSDAEGAEEKGVVAHPKEKKEAPSNDDDMEDSFDITQPGWITAEELHQQIINSCAHPEPAVDNNALSATQEQKLKKQLEAIPVSRLIHPITLKNKYVPEWQKSDDWMVRNMCSELGFETSDKVKIFDPVTNKRDVGSFVEEQLEAFRLQHFGASITTAQDQEPETSGEATESYNAADPDPVSREHLAEVHEALADLSGLI